MLKFSAIEIYNEVVRDLLSAENTPLRLWDDAEVIRCSFSAFLTSSDVMLMFANQFSVVYSTERHLRGESYGGYIKGLEPPQGTYFCLRRFNIAY